MKETLEEASKNRGLRWHKEGTIGFMHSKGDFLAGAKWQAERMYSEEEVLEQLNLLYAMKNSTVDTYTDDEDYITNKWFENYKKK
jgi:hypothetical protein